MRESSRGQADCPVPELTPNPASDFHFIACADPEDGVEKILRLVTERIPARFGLDPVRDVQVLCPMNRGGLGARSLNLERSPAAHRARPVALRWRLDAAIQAVRRMGR